MSIMDDSASHPEMESGVFGASRRLPIPDTCPARLHDVECSEMEMEARVARSRAAFFEEVRALNAAYVQSRRASSTEGDTTQTDEILAALASELGYADSACGDPSAVE